MIIQGPRAPEPVLQHVGPGAPDSSSPHSAASAIRRSPGGRQSSSSRSRPEDPPSSATVTIAVRWSVTRRKAVNDAASPCPPPKATTFGRVGPNEPDGKMSRQIAGVHSRPKSRWRTVVGEAPARSRRANSSAMAELRCLPPVQPMREGGEPLTLSDVADRDDGHQVLHRGEERLGARSGRAT